MGKNIIARPEDQWGKGGRPCTFLPSSPLSKVPQRRSCTRCSDFCKQRLNPLLRNLSWQWDHFGYLLLLHKRISDISDHAHKNKIEVNLLPKSQQTCHSENSQTWNFDHRFDWSTWNGRRIAMARCFGLVQNWGSRVVPICPNMMASWIIRKHD
jgi:hypothetical protein